MDFSWAALGVLSASLSGMATELELIEALVAEVATDGVRRYREGTHEVERVDAKTLFERADQLRARANRGAQFVLGVSIDS